MANGAPGRGRVVDGLLESRRQSTERRRRRGEEYGARKEERERARFYASVHTCNAVFREKLAVALSRPAGGQPTSQPTQCRMCAAPPPFPFYTRIGLGISMWDSEAEELGLDTHDAGCSGVRATGVFGSYYAINLLTKRSRRLHPLHRPAQLNTGAKVPCI